MKYVEYINNIYALIASVFFVIIYLFSKYQMHKTKSRDSLLKVILLFIYIIGSGALLYFQHPVKAGEQVESRPAGGGGAGIEACNLKDVESGGGVSVNCEIGK